MPIIFCWILLIIALIDVMVALVQLLFLYGMQLIIYKMHSWQAWLLVVGTPVLAVCFVVMSLFATEQRRAWFLVGLIWLLSFMVFQYAATRAIWDKLGERHQDVVERAAIRSTD